MLLFYILTNSFLTIAKKVFVNNCYMFNIMPNLVKHIKKKPHSLTLKTPKI